MPFEHATSKPSDADPVDIAASGRRVIEIEIEGLRAIAARIDGAFSAACQLLLGHRKLESTVRYLGIEVDDALELSEQLEI